MGKTLLLAAALLAGCNGPQVPGDGTLVVVDADPAFSRKSFVDADTGRLAWEVDAVRQGTHYWDEVGARLRLPDEVSPEEAAGAVHFGLHRDSYSWPGVSEPSNGIDWKGLGYATIYPNVGDTRSSTAAFAEVVAHELGHALGLGHTPDGVLAIMSPVADWYQPRLADADVAEFQTVWGASAVTHPELPKPIRCRVTMTAPALSLVIPGGGLDADGDDCVIPDGGPGDTFQVGLHHGDWTVVLAAPRGQFAVGQPLSPSSQVSVLYQGASWTCREWAGSVTVDSDGIEEGASWGVSLDLTCSSDPATRLAGTLSGSVGPYY